MEMDRCLAGNMPKIELHCHLDGSISVGEVQRLLQRLGEEHSAEELRERLRAPMNCESLAQYLERFDLPIRCLQDARGLRGAAHDLASAAAREHVRYLEVRFAPAFSTERGLSVRAVLESVQQGLSEAESETGIITGILVCGMRNLDMETNLAMLKEARELYGCGVVGCDLAGDEMAYPTARFADFFRRAMEYGMPFTIHAGECGRREEIRTALALGARRIGHGIAMKGDRDLMRTCADRRIGVELCPTSNLQTKAIRDIADYPLAEFMEAHVPVSVNTDNRTVSGTTCTEEFLRLSDAGMLDESICEQIYRDSVEVCFASDDVKHRLLEVNKWH